jgi:hypothetical protein
LVSVTAAADRAGEVMSRTINGQVNKPAATAIAKGTLLKLDAANGNFIVAPATASAAGRFVVAIKDAAANDAKVLVAKKGPVSVRVQGTIKPHNFVAASATVAGAVAEAAATVAGLVGTYEGHTNGNEHDGEVVVQATDTEIAWIDLNEGLS